MAEKQSNINVKAIKKIMSLMKRQEVTELDIEQEGVKIHIKRGEEAQAQVQYAPPQPLVQAPLQAMPAPAAAPAAPAAPPASSPDEGLSAVTSPMVGTFYTSAGPDAPPYAKVGDAIKEGQTLCIIEAMKLMNEIKAEAAGTLVKVLVENAQAVEYGQKLFLIEPLKS